MRSFFLACFTRLQEIEVRGKESVFVGCFLLFNSLTYAQKDTSAAHGTIKIGKQKDVPVYVKSISRLKVYAKDPHYKDISYSSYTRWVQNGTPLKASNRVLISEAQPAIGNAPVFDYSAYFQSNVYTRDVRLRKGESDTVRLHVSIDKKGKVRFADDLPIERLGDTIAVFSDYEKKKYKIDVSHVKTLLAFEQLSQEKWIPAKIRLLKTHPSKRRNKYKSSTGYTEGFIIVVYSTSPFGN